MRLEWFNDIGYPAAPSVALVSQVHPADGRMIGPLLTAHEWIRGRVRMNNTVLFARGMISMHVPMCRFQRACKRKIAHAALANATQSDIAWNIVSYI